MNDQLTEFLRARRQQSGAQEIDWNAKRESWKKAVEQLYSLVRELLSSAVKTGDVTISEHQEQITEEYVGAYSIPVLEIRVGHERVELRPKGMTVIGASGRVDLRGERDEVTLIRDEKSEQGWSVIIRRTPAVETVPFDRESLKLALERAMLPLS